MTKILNLDKIETKQEKAIVLNGKEHVMKTFTVKEYIYHMKEARKLAEKADDLENLGAGIEITIKILCNAFPTVKKEEFEALTMQQLDAIRGLIEETNDDELTPDEDEQGETEGEVK